MRIWHLLVATLMSAVALALARSSWGRLVLLGTAAPVAGLVSLRLLEKLDRRVSARLEAGQPALLIYLALMAVILFVATFPILLCVLFYICISLMISPG